MNRRVLRKEIYVIRQLFYEEIYGSTTQDRWIYLVISKVICMQEKIAAGGRSKINFIPVIGCSADILVYATRYLPEGAQHQQNYFQFSPLIGVHDGEALIALRVSLGLWFHWMDGFPLRLHLTYEGLKVK